MGNWGISENASEKEKIKQEVSDCLAGLNSTGVIDYTMYCNLYDRIIDGSLEKMYELGKKEGKMNLINKKPPLFNENK
ncbi:hypothetical protein D3C75_628290 [compost metagenome]